MLVSSKGIVLHHIKYGESSVIATIYTEKSGRQTYIVNATRSKNAINKAGYLQPLFIVDLVAYEKQTRDVQRIKEIKLEVPFQSIPYNVLKSTQSIFIAEILYRILHEEESYPKLFSFLENSIHYFDLMDEGVNNFHLYFLVRLTEYLGINPNTEFFEIHHWFDLKRGVFTSSEPTHNMFMNKEITSLFKKLLKVQINELGQLNFSRQNRELMLGKLIDYYHSHFNTMGGLKSLSILKEVFK